MRTSQVLYPLLPTLFLLAYSESADQGVKPTLVFTRTLGSSSIAYVVQERVLVLGKPDRFDR